MLGWAVDINAGGSIKEIQFLRNGSLIELVTPSHDRPDVAAYLNRPAVVRCGWDCRVERNRLRSDDVIAIKIVNHKDRSTNLAYDLFSSMTRRDRAAG